MRFSHIALRLALLLALVVQLSSCKHGISYSYSISGGSLPARTGPEFQETFPDPATLIHTSDVATTRKLLDTIPMPETKKHHEALVRVLDEVDSIDSDHLVLLTEAVAIPTRTADQETSGSIHITTVNGRIFVYSRGEGEFAPVIDELVLAGAKKLSNVGPASFGQLATVTQSARTLVALSDILLEESDDGSTQSLETILKNIPFSDIREELCVQVLLPRQRLTGSRMSVAIESMSFDSNRSRLIAAIYKTLDTLEAATLIQHVKLQSFDSGRIKVVALGVPILESLNGGEMLRLVGTASFDSGRSKIMSLAKSKLRLQSGGEVLALMKTNSFDSGRKETLQILLESDFPTVSDTDLVAFANIASFDGDRGAMLRMVAPHFDGKFTAASAKRLLLSFSFDDARLKLVRTYREPLRQLPFDSRTAILDAFTFSGDRDRAMKLIMR